MQDLGSTSNQRIAARRTAKTILLLTIVIASSLLMTAAALAQQSPYFDLGCWSVTTGGGGARVSPNFHMVDAVGQNATGISASPNFQLRAGYAQTWGFLAPATPPIVTPSPPPSNTVVINLPLISYNVVIQRTCPY